MVSAAYACQGQKLLIGVLEIIYSSRSQKFERHCGHGECGWLIGRHYDDVQGRVDEATAGMTGICTSKFQSPWQ